MIDPKCLGPDIDRSQISPDATVRGESYLTGPLTRVEARAVIESARLENVAVAAGARVVDSIVTVDPPVKSHRCDVAGRFVAAGTDRPRIGPGSLVHGSTLINTSVEADASIRQCWISNSRLGQRNRFHQVKMSLCHCGADISLQGPTEFSESSIGDGLSVDRCGYFEAVFSNTFHVLDFEPSTGRLVVREVIDLPHTSRYGQNVICSTNSGRLRPTKDGRPLRSLGPRVRLWHDSLLSHEPIRMEPCCWVSEGTKLIGESAVAYESDEAILNDRRATLLMPFAVAGFTGDVSRGLVMPGERAIGIRPHERFPAWTFTYAPGAVIAMVRRVHDLLPLERRAIANELVTKSIRTARAMVRAVRHTERDPAWRDWADRAELLLTVHLEEELWRFEGGRPCEWYREKATGHWVHPRQDRLLEFAPDLLNAQVEEKQLIDSTLTRSRATGTPLIPPRATGRTEDGTRFTTPLSFTKQDTEPTTIDAAARIAEAAVIGPGCRIGPEVIIGPGAQLWNTTLHACEIGANSLIQRCDITDATIGSEVTLRSSVVTRSQIGDRSTIEAASVVDTTLADFSTVSAFADLKEVLVSCGTILGGRFEGTKSTTCLMSMHMAGHVSNARAQATPVTMENGRTIFVKAIPMIGAGARCDGIPEAPIRMEGCFIGSNARIEPGVRLGFGSFVLGRIGPDVELPPLTLAFGGDPATYRLGEVLTRLPEVVVTHFLGWTYQASSEPAEIEAVARVVEASIRRGVESIRHEQSCRSGGGLPGASDHFDLTPYSDAQLEKGLAIYEQALARGRWRMKVEAGELVFCLRCPMSQTR